jgi:hypothetical protein
MGKLIDTCQNHGAFARCQSEVVEIVRMKALAVGGASPANERTTWDELS